MSIKHLPSALCLTRGQHDAQENEEAAQEGSVGKGCSTSYRNKMYLLIFLPWLSMDPNEAAILVQIEKRERELGPRGGSKPRRGDFRPVYPTALEGRTPLLHAEDSDRRQLPAPSSLAKEHPGQIALLGTEHGENPHTRGQGDSPHWDSQDGRHCRVTDEGRVERGGGGLVRAVAGER